MQLTWGAKLAMYEFENEVGLNPDRMLDDIGILRLDGNSLLWSFLFDIVDTWGQDTSVFDIPERFGTHIHPKMPGWRSGGWILASNRIHYQIAD